MVEGETTGLGARWSWSPEIWSWSPERDVWTPEAGLPPGTLQIEIDATAVPPRQRFDYWRHATRYDSDFGLPFRGAAFEANGFCLLSPRGMFSASRSSPIVGRSRRIAGWPSDLSIGLVLAGERRSETSDGETRVTKAGKFFAYDPDISTQFSWTEHQCAFLSVRRSELLGTLGRRSLGLGRLTDDLDRSTLGSFLRQHMKQFYCHSRALSPLERQAVLNVSFDLLMAALAQVAEDSLGGGERSSSGVRIAALRHIDRFMFDSTLDSGKIARAIGCSRATLYRAFSDQKRSVSDMLCDARLDRAKRLLLAEPRTSIASVGERCGWPNSRTFGQRFKQSFGMTPSELRAVSLAKRLDLDADACCRNSAG
jgi:AraC family transcriptional regulator, positive regulator of tynA and feaB